LLNESFFENYILKIQNSIFLFGFCRFLFLWPKKGLVFVLVLNGKFAVLRVWNSTFFMNNLLNDTTICLPLFFSFFLVILPKEIIWSKNRHFIYFNARPKASAHENMVHDAVQNTGAWRYCWIHISNRFWSNG